MEVMPPNTNRALTITASPIQLHDLRIRAGSCHEAIMAVLTSDPGLIGQAVSADDVESVLTLRGARYARGTVYKTLRRMARQGLLTWSRSRFHLPDAGPTSVY